VQLPLLQLADPERDQLRPAGPVPPPCHAHAPPEQLPDPPKLVVPRGPLIEPVRVQALASTAAAAESVTPSNRIPKNLFTSLSRMRVRSRSRRLQQDTALSMSCPDARPVSPDLAAWPLCNGM
jgi:hypothetical protein